jgi:tetratricopeptide (TPR) repeat protein
MASFPEVVMKSTAMGFARWIGLAGLLSACCVLQTQNVLAQKLVSSGHNYLEPSTQEPSTPSSTDGLPVITPELNADLLAAHQHYMEAITAYKIISPQTAATYNKIGMAYQHLSMVDEATSYYHRAIHTDRKFAAPYNNLGTIYYHKKDNKQAQRLYRKSISLDGSTAAFWSNLGAVYLANQKYRDGAEAYQRAFTLDSNIFQEISMNGIREFASNEDMAKMYFCFAEIYAQAGMKDVALDYLRKALLEGFHDNYNLLQDQQLAILHGTPEFDRLLATEHKK